LRDVGNCFMQPQKFPTWLRSFARDGRLRCHRSAMPRGRVGPPRGTMFPNSGGEGRTPPGAVYVNFLISPDSRCNSADSRHHVP
jgi:hypothetical protein